MRAPVITLTSLFITATAHAEWLTVTPENAEKNGVSVKQLQVKYGDMWCRGGVGVTVAVPRVVNGNPITHALLGVKDSESMKVSLSSPLAFSEDGSPAYICLSQQLIRDAIVSVSYGDSVCGPKDSFSISLGAFVELQKP